MLSVWANDAWFCWEPREDCHKLVQSVLTPLSGTGLNDSLHWNKHTNYLKIILMRYLTREFLLMKPVCQVGSHQSIPHFHTWRSVGFQGPRNEWLLYYTYPHIKECRSKWRLTRVLVPVKWESNVCHSILQFHTLKYGCWRRKHGCKLEAQGSNLFSDHQLDLFIVVPSSNPQPCMWFTVLQISTAVLNTLTLK